MSAAVALVVAVALMALGMAASAWLQRAEARREEVRRLAWQAAEEVEIAEREEAYGYGQYGGVFVRASDVPEAPPLWAAPEARPAPNEAEDEVAVVAPAPAPAPAPAAAAAAAAASPPAGKGVCAMCARPTTLRCKRCKSVKYWSVSFLSCSCFLLFDSCRLCCCIARRARHFFFSTELGCYRFGAL